MATIQSPGIGSGLDVNSIVESLIEAEGAVAQQSLDSREARLQVQISALGALKSAASEFRASLSGLKTTSTFNTRSITANQEGLVSLEAGTAAVPGSYRMKVLQLAQAQKVATIGFDSEGVALGTGTLNVNIGERSFAIEVDDSNNTLAGLRDAINDALGGEGISATLLNVDDPDDPEGGTHTRMLITSEKSGSDQVVTFSVADDDGNNTDTSGLSALASSNLELLSEARDSIVEIEGLTVTSATNTLENVVDGVTIELTKADLDTEIEITVAEDHTEVIDAVNQFVEGYNTLITSIAGSDSYDSDSETAGALLGDASVRSFRLALIRIMGTIDREAESAYNSLPAIGITTNTDGTLTLDSSTLERALESNREDVLNLFTREDAGIGVQLDDMAYAYSRFDGVFTSRLEGLDARVDDIADERIALQARLDASEARYRSQFEALDQLMSTLTQTGSFLAQAFSTDDDS